MPPVPLRSFLSFFFFIRISFWRCCWWLLSAVCPVCPVSCVIPGVPFCCCCCCDSNIIYTFTRSLLSRIYQSNWNLFVVALLSHTQTPPSSSASSAFPPFAIIEKIWRHCKAIRFDAIRFKLRHHAANTCDHNAGIPLLKPWRERAACKPLLANMNLRILEELKIAGVRKKWIKVVNSLKIG